MSDLYEKISHKDRKTIVREYEAGTELSLNTVPPQTIKLKADAALKVTQEYNAYSRTWHDVTIHLKDMVETATARLPRPEPTSMPGPIEMPVPKLPRAEVRRPWWKFW